MSDIDSFIEEVTEEVRRDKLFAAFRKYGWIGILAVVLIVGGVAWQQWHKAQLRAAAETFGNQVLAAQDAATPEAQIKALDAIRTVQPGQAAILDFLAADAAQASGKTAEAVKRLDAIAANKALPIGYRDLATLKKVLIAGKTMTPDQRKAALAPLSDPGRPYRPLALEQLAMLAVAQGDTKSALSQFQAILDDAGMTPGLRRRATQMIVALGGSPKAS